MAQQSELFADAAELPGGLVHQPEFLSEAEENELTPAPVMAPFLLPLRERVALKGEARWGWQHSIAPTRELRYSITFRTRKAA